MLSIVKMKCQAVSKCTGKKCRNLAMVGKKNCGVHKGHKASKRMTGGTKKRRSSTKRKSVKVRRGRYSFRSVGGAFVRADWIRQFQDAAAANDLNKMNNLVNQYEGTKLELSNDIGMIGFTAAQQGNLQLVKFFATQPKIQEHPGMLLNAAVDRRQLEVVKYILKDLKYVPGPASSRELLATAEERGSMRDRGENYMTDYQEIYYLIEDAVNRKFV